MLYLNINKSSELVLVANDFAMTQINYDRISPFRSYLAFILVLCTLTSRSVGAIKKNWTIERKWQHWVHKKQDEDKQNKKHTTLRKQTQIT
jgi:hypothetical protein